MNDRLRKTVDPDKIEWNKSADGLVPAIVQDDRTGRVLMLAWMTRESLRMTIECGKATFFSRSRNRLWVKGETSGNWLNVESIDIDCDGDTLLVMARPDGPTCHRGTTTCFSEGLGPRGLFLGELATIIESRVGGDPNSSYTARLLAGGMPRLAQKVGEEGVETALAAVAGSDESLLDESADLIFHLMVLLTARGLTLSRVIERLAERHSGRQTRTSMRQDSHSIE